MAYFTEITAPRELTEAESTQLLDYVDAQKTATTTNGSVYIWNATPGSDTPETQTVRMWSTSESAAGYQAVLAGFSPAIPVSIY